MDNYLIIAGIGILAGLLSGLLGIGGAIIVIPALVLALGYSQELAQGTTLLMLSVPVASLAAWQYYKAGNADIKTAAVLAVSFLVAGFFGAKLANFIPQDILKKAFAILLIVIAVKMLFLDKTVEV